MSYDIDLCCRACGGYVRDPATGEGCLEPYTSPTYNYAPMLLAASEIVCGERRGFHWLHGRFAIDVQPWLVGCAEVVSTNPEVQSLAPGNGWGTPEGLVKILRHYAAMCSRAPGAVFNTEYGEGLGSLWLDEKGGAE